MRQRGRDAWPCAAPLSSKQTAAICLATTEDLLLSDVIAAEIVFVLESFYKVGRAEVARLMRSVLAFEAIRTIDATLLLRALEVYETDRLDFADAYLVACAETAGVAEIASFDKAFDRVGSVTRIEP